jgi:hypothetical protein
MWEGGHDVTQNWRYQDLMSCLWVYTKSEDWSVHKTLANQYVMRQFLLCCIPMIYIVNRCLLLMITCHVTWTLHWFKYWPFLYFHQTVNVAQVKWITGVCLLMKSRCAVAFPQLHYTWQAEKWFMCRWSVSFSISSRQVPQSWECDGIDQAYGWQVFL